MPVQIQVKGPQNGLDFILTGHDARIERVQSEKEIVLVLDVDGNVIYSVPLPNVRLIQPVAKATQPVPRHVGQTARVQVHIIGDSEGDFQQVCDNVIYPKPFYTLMADLFNVTAEGNGQPVPSRVLSVPFDNIRYIDFNYIDPTATNDKPEVKTKEEQPLKPQGQKAPAQKPQGNKPQGQGQKPQGNKPSPNGGTTTNKPVIKAKPRN